MIDCLYIEFEQIEKDQKNNFLKGAFAFVLISLYVFALFASEAIPQIGAFNYGNIITTSNCVFVLRD